MTEKKQLFKIQEMPTLVLANQNKNIDINMVANYINLKFVLIHDWFLSKSFRLVLLPNPWVYLFFKWDLIKP